MNDHCLHDSKGEATGGSVRSRYAPQLLDLQGELRFTSRLKESIK